MYKFILIIERGQSRCRYYREQANEYKNYTFINTYAQKYNQEGCKYLDKV